MFTFSPLSHGHSSSSTPPFRYIYYRLLSFDVSFAITPLHSRLVSPPRPSMASLPSPPFLSLFPCCASFLPNLFAPLRLSVLHSTLFLLRDDFLPPLSVPQLFTVWWMALQGSTRRDSCVAHAEASPCAPSPVTLHCPHQSPS